MRLRCRRRRSRRSRDRHVAADNVAADACSANGKEMAMESLEQNKFLTQVGRGTPMGELLRRYWMPIAAASDLDSKWTKRVRLLGEDLVVFKDRQGRLGLI